MDIYLILSKLSHTIYGNGNRHCIEEDMKFIRSFSEPKDDVERSYFQYTCQNRNCRKWILIWINIVSFPLVVVYLTLQIVKMYTSVKIEEDSKAIFIPDGKPNNILPPSLIEEYLDITSVCNDAHMLSANDLRFIVSVIKRYPFSWLFVFKIAIKISKYRWIIEKYHPQAIIVCNEYSYTSSILTMFCKMNQILHVDIMHGEKLLSLQEAFFHYDKCYVWEPHYENIFREVRALSKFVISEPLSLHFSGAKSPQKADYTYYLGDENSVVLDNVLRALLILKEKGYIVAVRPHPRYSNIKAIQKKFENVIIENCQLLTIEDSLMSTRNAIARYSTVLYQAYKNNIQVVIDDVSDVAMYDQLKDRGYIMITKSHMLLSTLIINNTDSAL